jgi:hypothetical protein
MLILSHHGAVLLIVVNMMSMMSMTAYATSDPQPQEQSITATTTNSTVYTDDTGFTVSLPPGWTPVDRDNTSQEAREVAASQLKETLVEFCPEGQSRVDNTTGIAGCDDDLGIIVVTRYINMDTNPDFAYGASTVDPSTGLIVLDLTAQDLVDLHNRDSPNMIIVQSKDLLVNVSNSGNAGTQWQIPGKLILAANQINQLGWIQLLFVDWTSGYELSYRVPKGQGGSGEPISIFGIGLDNLPQELQPIIQIMTSVNLQRLPSG